MLIPKNQLLLTNTILALALVWIIITAYQSVGFLHGDEHYQLLEFAGLKLGFNQPSNLAWEYEAQIRPSLQPYIACVIISMLKAMDIHSPFNQAFVLRVITGVFCFLSVTFFWKKTKNQFTTNLSIWYLAASFFIWFFPYIYVRFSSETWSLFTFLLGVSFLYKGEKGDRKVILGTFFLGLSIIFRIQTVTMLFGYFMWSFFVKKETWKELAKWAGVILIVFTCSVFLDSLFYGEPVFTAWNYLKVNLFESKAAEFGVSPWYSYFWYIFKSAYIPLGLLIISSFFYLLFTQPKNQFIWIVFPLLFIHSLIGHKELRFLYPALPFLPIMIFTVIQKINFNNKLMKYGLAFLIVINVVGLFICSLKPARHGDIKIVEDIVALQSQDNTTIISYNSTNPINPWGLPVRFYYNKDFKDIRLEKLEDLKTLSLENQECFLTLKKKNLSVVTKEMITDLGFVEHSQSIPHWMERMLNLYGAYNISEVVVLYVRKTPDAI